MDLGLKGKSVFISAASKGLGKACALAFAREGSKVTISSRDESRLRQTAMELERETGNPVQYVVVDVTNSKSIENGIRVAAEFGNGLDVLVTNAGGPPAGPFEKFSDEGWQQAFELNLLSVVRLVRASVPYMRKGGAGRIVNLTSSSIKQPIDNLVLSNTYRAGVHGLTKSLAIELAKDGILVNTVAPGRIGTDRVAELDRNKADASGVSVDQVAAESRARIPVGRYGNPDEFGRTVAFIASYTQAYLTGQALLVDGGMVRAL